MITGHQLIVDMKVQYIVHEIIMGTRTTFPFSSLFFASDNGDKRRSNIQGINRSNIMDLAHYMVEMGYMNAFNQDDSVGQKQRAWYETRMKEAFRFRKIQLFCLLYSRSVPVFNKYGESTEISIDYFDILTKGLINCRKSDFVAEATYTILSEYAAMIYKIISVWKAASARGGAVQTRSEFKEWLNNEKEFIENIYIADGRLITAECEKEKNKFEQKRKIMLKVIEEVQGISNMSREV